MPNSRTLSRSNFTRTLLLAPVAFAFACSEPKVEVADVTTADPAPLVADTPIDVVAKADPFVPKAETKESPPAKEPTLLEKEAIFHDDTTTDFVSAGNDLVADSRPGEAIEMFRKALFAQPTPGVWAKLGESYVKAGQAERGIACLEEALEGATGNIRAREQVVRAYLDANDAAAARVHAERLAQLDAGSASSHFLLGRSYMKLSMWHEAVEAFDKSLEIEPTSSFAHNNLGYSALMIGANDLAVEHLEATIDLEPVRHYMLNNLGLAYERQGRGADALAAYLRAAELKPGYVNAIVNRDRVRMTLTEDERQLAIEILDELKTAPVPGVTTAAIDPTEEPAGVEEGVDAVDIFKPIEIE
jgi:tetratricopeptide (TPR) repeat protein